MLTPGSRSKNIARGTVELRVIAALARLHVHNLTRRSSLEARSKREKKGGEESGDT
jgi:hypothetical protein